MIFYTDFQKLDQEQRMVWGYASTEAVDSDGEIVTKAAMRAAWTEYMDFGNVREMHKPSAVGVVKEYRFDDVGTWIGAKIVDKAAWEKVQEGVYKGFSVAGKVLQRKGIRIEKLKLTEISLVDRGANPEARIELFKLDDEGDEVARVTKTMDEKEAVVDALLEKAANVDALLEQVAALLERSAALDGLLTKADGAVALLAKAENLDEAFSAAGARLDESHASLEDFGKRLALLEAAPAAPLAAVSSVAISKLEDSSPDPEPTEPDSVLSLIRKSHSAPRAFGFGGRS